MPGYRLAANLRKIFSLKVGDHFRSVAGLVSRGLRAPRAQLFNAVAEGQQSPDGYTYSLVSQHSPERLGVHHKGQQVLGTPVSTGVPQRPAAAW